MSTRTLAYVTPLLVAAWASPVLGQQQGSPAQGQVASAAPAAAPAAAATNAPPAAPTDPTDPPAPRPAVIQNLRPADQRGINVFETPKDDGVPFTGFKLDWGGAFTQQFQSLTHENTADAVMVNGVNSNQLMDIGAGFNNATANLDLNVQVAQGMRVALTTYLSSRHHNEAWVKDGYLLVDASPIDAELLNDVMKVVTLKLGHFEIDYGDAHFRRSDNGNAMYNPFVGNLILDGFTTQIGGHLYARKNGFLAMAGITGGEIKGEIRFPEQRGPAYLGKLGFDKQLNADLRVRLTGSYFTQAKSISNTLYSGDRGGSRYSLVMENTAATTTAQAWSGAINPSFKNEVASVMVNPFIEVKGLELFGTYERTEGRASTEADSRVWTQYAGEAVYRFLPNDAAYVGARYNSAKGELPGLARKASADRTQISAGWFLTPNVLMKGEWVTQRYNDFAANDIRNGGRFRGFVIEGVVAF